MGRTRNASSKDVALADLARLKSAGRSGRAADYEVKEQAMVYDEVDDETYAEHAAKLRAATRDFVDRGDRRERTSEDGSEEEDEDDYFDEEHEFALEDEMSILHRDGDGAKKKSTSRNRRSSTEVGKKRRRGASGPGAVRKTNTGAPGSRRVSAAFFGGFGGPSGSVPGPAAGSGQTVAADTRPLVFDPAALDQELDAWDQAKKARRLQRKNEKAAAVGDLMFDDDFPIRSRRPALGAGGRKRRGDFDGVGDLGLFDNLSPVRTAVPSRSDEYNAPPPMVSEANGAPFEAGGGCGEEAPSAAPKTAAELLNSSALAANSVPQSHKESGPMEGSEDAGEEEVAPVAAREDTDEGTERLNDGSPEAENWKSSLAKRQSVPAGPTQKQRLEASIAVAAATAKENVAPAPLRSNLPLARDKNGDIVMFWTDAHDVRVNGGEHLYLFGKAPVDRLDSGVYASVCVLVKGVERAIYVLPRSEKHPVKDVYPEVCSRLLAGKATGAAYSSNLPSQVRAKVVQRMCPFGDPDAPREATDYLKVKFPYEFANNFAPNSSGKSFKRVYGVKTSASEMACLKRGLKGPAWIRISEAAPHVAKVSHARHTLVINSPANISVAADMAETAPPPLSTLCVSSKTVLNPRTGAHELVMLSGVFVPDVPLDCALDQSRLDPGAQRTREFVLLRAAHGRAIPFGFQDRARAAHVAGSSSIEIVPNEAVLLNNFVAKLLQLDPDALVGHDLYGFGFDVLIARMAAQRTRKWSCLGRLVQHRDLGSVVKNNSSTSFFKAEAVAGRLVCDTQASAKEILYKEKDYTLSALSANVLGFGPADPAYLPPATAIENVPVAFESTDNLCRLVAECSAEARTAGRLSARLSILPLSKQLTCISGNLWSRTLQGARAQRIEFLLCHEFLKVGSKKGGDGAKAGNTTCKLLLPDKLTRAEKASIEAMTQVQKSPHRSNDAEPGRKKSEEIRGGKDQVSPATGFGGGFEVTPGAKNDVPGDAGGTTGRGASKSKSTRRKPQYLGGLVLEPKKGLYDHYVLQLDFNSLYPSIIQEFNICFTTLALDPSRTGKAEEAVVSSPEDLGEVTGSNDAAGSPGDPTAWDLLPDSSVGVGVLPRVLRDLVQQRRRVKVQLKNEKDPVKRSQLDIRQTAIKLTANSLYGCLGFEGSRFYAQTLAALVTSQGRSTLQSTVAMAREEFNAEVIYGDTDSLFVNTGLNDINRVRELGMQLKRAVNAKYKTLEIEIDAIYSKMLLLKKKKYAALKVINPLRPAEVEREVKGLDLVRHDWCDLSHDASEHFLQQVFTGNASNVDESVSVVLTFLEQLALSVRSNQVALSKYVITKSLTKDPNQYADAKGLPHVQVALRMRRNGQRIGNGDYVKYVICKRRAHDPDGGKTGESVGKAGGSDESGFAEMAFHPDEVLSSMGELEIDTNYYLENQVLPPIIRLCDPIPSVNGAQLALALGLNAKKYMKQDSDGFHSGAAQNIDELKIKCSSCRDVSVFRGIDINTSTGKLKSNGLNCSRCFTRYKDENVANALTLHIRQCVRKYYSTAYKLNGDDGSRSRDTRCIGLGGNSAIAERELGEEWLYYQLRSLRDMMDIASIWRQKVEGGGDTGRVTKDGESSERQAGGDGKPFQHGEIATYDRLLRIANNALDVNGYRYVDLTSFLAPLGLVE